MKYLDDLMHDINSEYESFDFLKQEVLELAAKNYQLERDLAMIARNFDTVCQRAYDHGYEEGLRGTKFDTKFNTDSEGDS